MAVPFLTAINLNNNEIQNVALQNLANDPSNPAVGQIYYNTSNNVIRYYDGSTWIDLQDVIQAAENSPITVADDGQGNITLDIAVATTSSRGSMSADDKQQLDNATSTIASNTLVLRDANGNIQVSDPLVDADAATKGYVDATAQGLDIKDSVRLATDENLPTLSGELLIDGVQSSDGDRVLVKNQNNLTENGIYVVSTGGWSRAEDADENDEVNAGMFTFVEEGNVYQNTGWVVTTPNPIQVDTTNIEFVQFSGAGLITAGDGLTKSGNTIDVVGTEDRITANQNSIDIASTYVGQTSITTLGTVTTGVWEATDVAVEHGGTGASDATTARANLDTPGRYSETITVVGAQDNTFTINHNLNTQDVQVFLRRNAGNFEQVFADVEVTDVNNVTVKTAGNANLDSDEFRVTVIG